jgi:GH25 family lysozyme M1 (1,4-beta-N-acetylmuramidase)
MLHLRICGLALGCLVLFANAPLLADDCKPVAADSAFPFRNDDVERNPFAGDSGIVPQSFVDAGATPVVHGVDVSKYDNKIDFAESVRCGSRFVYVRLSAGSRGDNELQYRTLWQNARSVLRGPKGFVGGYHNFSFVESPTRMGFASLSEAEKDNFSKQSQDLARVEAKLLLIRLTEVLSLDIKSDCGAPETEDGCPYLPIALDLSTRPQMNGSTDDRTEFGDRVYAPAICAWIRTVQDSAPFHDQPIMLFIAPDTYRDYGLGNAPCPLKALPIWIRDHNKTGGPPGSEADINHRAAVAELCKPDPASKFVQPLPIGRCIFHQYTSFGGFAVFDLKASLDLNRFYGTLDTLGQLQQRKQK